jgi:dolichol-phosphate mannosyltransferase
MSVSLSVAIPALNEENGIRGTVENVVSAIAGCPDISRYELILINDGSTDNTRKVMKQLVEGNRAIRMLDNGINRGLGYSYKRGLGEATGDYFSWVPSDDTFSAEGLYKLYKQIGQADIILHYPQAQNRRFYRIFISSLYKQMLRIAFGIYQVKYFNGLAIYRREDIAAIQMRSSGFFFQAELLIKTLRRRNCSIIQTPIFTTERRDGKTHIFSLRNISDALRSLCVVYKDIHAR